MVSQSLIAFDTDHIKGYVFGTSKLKEIRGASSRLDYLNRVLTREKAESKAFGATTIYAHGGSALFLIDSDESEKRARALTERWKGPVTPLRTTDTRLACSRVQRADRTC